MACHAQIADQVGLCMTCWGDVQFINAPICDVTGTPLPHDSDENILSIEALTDPPHYDKARAALRFNEHSRRLIHKLKYHDQQHLAPLMAKMMLRAAGDLLVAGCGDTVICSVPLYHWRYFRRRFNQADLLARQVASKGGSVYMPKLIKRIKATKTQVGLSREARQKNVKGAFEINAKWLKLARGKNIYIVDDVITTGATVNEIAGCLKAEGLGPVYILAFAKVIHQKVI
ncbi:MAG: amidophosphoribosyltransferase [Hyphomicrobiales bacterium]|nr:MAG: amidophosphoribosyltransferase [Hyphomicrobiales bacterium]